MKKKETFHTPVLSDLVGALHREYETRKLKNKNYSIRAFARFLGLDPSHLSKLLRGNKGLGQTKILQLGKKMRMSEAWITLATASFRKSDDAEPIALSPEFRKKVFRWYTLAIIELSRLDNFRAEPAWIAGILGITTTQAAESLQYLEEFKILVPIGGAGKKRKWVRSSPLRFPMQTGEEARAVGKHFLLQSLKSIEEIAPEFRILTSFLLPINMENLQSVRPLIKDFEKKISRLLQKGENWKDLYSFNISLVPITDIDKKKKS